MSSPEQLAANRANARRSTGPKTPEGKQKSARNAITHGINAKIAVLPAVENPDDWNTFRRDVVKSIAPDGALEDTLALRVATTLWRLQRLARYEHDLLEHDIETQLAATPPSSTPSHPSTPLARRLVRRSPGGEDGSPPDEVGSTPSTPSTQSTPSTTLDSSDAPLKPQISNLQSSPEPPPPLLPLLPDTADLDRIIRYERHLHYVLHRDLRELRRLRVERAKSQSQSEHHTYNDDPYTGTPRKYRHRSQVQPDGTLPRDPDDDEDPDDENLGIPDTIIEQMNRIVEDAAKLASHDNRKPDSTDNPDPTDTEYTLQPSASAPSHSTQASHPSHPPVPPEPARSPEAPEPPSESQLGSFCTDPILPAPESQLGSFCTDPLSATPVPAAPQPEFRNPHSSPVPRCSSQISNLKSQIPPPPPPVRHPVAFPLHSAPSHPGGLPVTPP